MEDYKKWLEIENEVSADNVNAIIEEIREDSKRVTWQKIIVPMQMAIIFLLTGAIGLMIWEFKGIELIVIMIFMFSLFITTTLLLLSGNMGLQLAFLRIPTLKKYAGDFLEIRFEDSGQVRIKISKWKDFLHFTNSKDVAKVQHAFFHEPDMGLPAQVGVQGFPMTVDPRQQYNEEPLLKIKDQLKSLSTVMISIFHLGRIKGEDNTDKILQIVTRTFYGIIILGILLIAVLYVSWQINAFFESHGTLIVETMQNAQAATKTILEEIEKQNITELIPTEG